jgi:hypothetical protein
VDGLKLLVGFKLLRLLKSLIRWRFAGASMLEEILAWSTERTIGRFREDVLVDA